MPTPIDPTSAAFLLAENRSMPMHVGGLQLFEKPEGAGRNYTREMFESMRDVEEIAAAVTSSTPTARIKTGGQLVWKEDDQFDIEHHVRHSALPKPGRVRELLDLCGRLHRTRLAWERPLWETHVIEGLRDGRVAHVLQAPPRPRRRRLGDAAAAERAEHRPRQARHARPLGRVRRLGAAASPRRTSTSPRSR